MLILHSHYIFFKGDDNLSPSFELLTNCNGFEQPRKLSSW